MWKGPRGIQETQILVGTLLCTCCLTPDELVDWSLWALVPSLKKGRNALTLPTSHGPVGITWQSTWALETVRSCPPEGPWKGFWLQTEDKAPVQDWGVDQRCTAPTPCIVLGTQQY